MKLRKTHLLWIPLVVCLFLVNSVNVMEAIEQVIHVKGQVVNPVNYYFMDLSAEDYDRMIQIAANHGKMMD